MIRVIYTMGSVRTDSVKDLIILGCMPFMLCILPVLLSRIDYSQGLMAYLCAGLLICFEVFFACILVVGILLIGHRTHITVDPKGLHVQETYFQGIKGKPVLFKNEELLRIYSNVKSEFPYFFLVYKRDGKKRIVGFDKSILKDYDQFLCALMELVPILNDGTWKYWDVKNAEKNKETN